MRFIGLVVIRTLVVVSVGTHSISHHGLQPYSSVCVVRMAGEMDAEVEASLQQDSRFCFGGFYHERNGQDWSYPAHIPTPRCEVANPGKQSDRHSYS